MYLDKGTSCQFQSFGQEELYKPKYDKYNIYNMKGFDMPVERGTLLIFKSSLPHKILKTDVERYSIAGNFASESKDYRSDQTDTDLSKRFVVYYESIMQEFNDVEFIWHTVKDS